MTRTAFLWRLHKNIQQALWQKEFEIELNTERANAVAKKIEAIREHEHKTTDDKNRLNVLEGQLEKVSIGLKQGIDQANDLLQQQEYVGRKLDSEDWILRAWAWVKKIAREYEPDNLPPNPPSNPV